MVDMSIAMVISTMPENNAYSFALCPEIQEKKTY